LEARYALFWKTVFDDLARDRRPKVFDAFDAHLYSGMYDIPERVGWFRAALDGYLEFAGTPIWVTEFGDCDESWLGDLLH